MTDNGISQRDLLLEVRSDVKDVKKTLEGKADRIEVKELAVLVAGKADRERVHTIESRLAAVDLAVATVARFGTDLQTIQADVRNLTKTVEAGTAISNYRRWLIPVILTALGTILVLLGYLISH